MTLTFGSLFAGIGGFDLGFTRAGLEAAWHVELDEKCRRVLAKHWPDAAAHVDVCEVGGDSLTDVDVVTFGFPCQDLSIAGKRAGLNGRRSGLFYEAARLIDELQPEYALFENVPGLLSSDGGRDFARVLIRLARSGYRGSWRVLDSQWLGVAQRRRRVFGLFSRGDSGDMRCAEILSISESLQRHPAPSREAGEGIAGTLESRTGAGGFPGTDGACGGHLVPAVAGCLDANYKRKFGCNQQVAAPGHLIAFHPTQDPISSEGVSHALGVGSSSGCATSAVALDAARVRRLTPTECLRLQGFPDDWLSGLGLSDSAKYRMLGNAVTVPVAEWIAKRIMAAETANGRTDDK